LRQYRYTTIDQRYNIADLIDFGGKIERGETPAQAATRELHEESLGVYAAEQVVDSDFHVSYQGPRGMNTLFFHELKNYTLDMYKRDREVFLKKIVELQGKSEALDIFIYDKAVFVQILKQNDGINRFYDKFYPIIKQNEQQILNFIKYI
jgi:hypothetical protein